MARDDNAAAECARISATAKKLIDEIGRVFDNPSLEDVGLKLVEEDGEEFRIVHSPFGVARFRLLWDVVYPSSRNGDRHVCTGRIAAFSRDPCDFDVAPKWLRTGWEIVVHAHSDPVLLNGDNSLAIPISNVFESAKNNALFTAGMILQYSIATLSSR